MQALKDSSEEESEISNLSSLNASFSEPPEKRGCTKFAMDHVIYELLEEERKIQFWTHRLVLTKGYNLLDSEQHSMDEDPIHCWVVQENLLAPLAAFAIDTLMVPASSATVESLLYCWGVNIRPKKLPNY